MPSLVTTYERAITDLSRAADRLTALPDIGHPEWLAHETTSALHGLLAAACAAELTGASLESMHVAAAAARDFYARRSAIIGYTQRWPRGFPGDFEVVEAMMNANPAGRPGTLEHALDACILQLPIVWQHRVKIAWQTQIVRQRLDGLAGARVLSIACGGSRDLARLEAHELARLEVVAVDIDDGALALTRRRLEPRVRALTCLQGNVLRLANRLRAAGPFDVVVAGGLLDYVPERAATVLLWRLATLLAPGGILAVTNIAAGNPWRLLLDLIANWRLIERDAYEMARLLTLRDMTADIVLDDTRLTWLARVTATGVTV